MATQSNESSKTKEKAVHQIERVSLYDFGYEKSGAAKGDPDMFSSYLTRIANGDLVEENYNGISEDEKKEKRELIKQLEKQQQDIETQNSKTEKEIHEKEKKIEELREQSLKIKEVHNNDHEKLKKESFSPFKFGINAFILLMLSGYLFLFYVSTAYKALYTDIDKVAEDMAEGIGVGSIMPHAYELQEAMKQNFLLFLVPFVFYAFGWAFHILLELKDKLKALYLGLLISVTFAVDYLLAMIIQTNTDSAKFLMGLDAKGAGSHSTFYMILALGFLVYIIWSLLLDSMLKEWDKRKVMSNIRKIIKHLSTDIKKLQKKIVPLDEIKAKIAAYREDVSVIMYGNLKKYTEQFSSGWIAYLAPNNMKAVKERCLGIKKDFEEKNGIKPGIVKVIARRG